MKGLTARDALTSAVLRVNGDLRPRDIFETINGEEILVCAVFENSTFLGLVDFKDILKCNPQRIFADLVPPGTIPRIQADTPINQVHQLLVTHRYRALPVFDNKGAFVGAVSKESLLNTLLKQREHVFRVTESVKDLLAQINVILDLKQMLRTALRETLEMLNLRTGWILLNREGRDKLVVRASLSREYSTKYAQSLRGACSCQQVLYSEMTEAAVLSHKCIKGASLNWHIVIPLVSLSKPVGAMALASTGRPSICDEELNLLTTLGKSIGSAILNIQGYRRLEHESLRLSRWSKRLSELNEASTHLLSLLGRPLIEDHLLQEGIETLSKLVGARYGAIGLFDENGKLAKFFHTGLTEEEAKRLTDLPKGFGILGMLNHTEKVVRLRDVKKHFAFSGFPEHHPHMKSFLGTRIALKGKVHGRIYLTDKREGNSFTEEDAKIIRTYATSLAMAIQHSQLLEDLNRSEQRFRSVTQSANDAIISTDNRGMIIAWNKGARDIFGYAETEVLGQPLTLLIPDRYKPAYTKRLAYLRSVKKSLIIGKTLELHGLRKDGTEFPVEISLSAWQTEEGRFYTGIVRDITKRKEAEEALKAYARHQAALVELGQFALKGASLSELMEKALKSLAQTLHVEYCKVLELLPDGKTMLLRAGVGWKKGYVGRATVKAGTESQAGYTLLANQPVVVQDLRKETRFSGPELLHDHGIISGVSVIIPGRKRPFGVLGVHTNQKRVFTTDDINYLQTIANVLAAAIERKHAEMELRKSQARFSGILDIAHEAIISLNEQQRIIIFNNGAEKIFGYTADEALGQHVDLLLPERFQSRHRKYIENLHSLASFARKMGERGEIYGRRKNGEEFPAEASISKLQMNGETIFTVVLRDITERKRLEEQLRQSQRLEAVGRLTSGIAHDFNNLLTVILGNAEFGLQDCTPGQPVYSDLVRIETAANQARDLVNQLLSFSRQREVNLKSFNLNEAIEDFLKLLQRTIGENIEVRTQLSKDLPAVYADPVHLQQVLMNICVNARDAMPRGGILTIRTDAVTTNQLAALRHFIPKSSKYARITITDTGIGMDDETQARVFEPFFTTKELGKGTGLGLSVVYGIVKQHNGHIELTSKKGEGTTVSIYLPAFKATTTVQQTTHSNQPSKTPISEKILVVEDDEAVCEVTARILKSLGYTVLTAQTEEQALSILKKHQRDLGLAILDVHLGAISGIELYRKLQLISPNLSVLFITGFDISADLASLSEDQRKRIHALQKPFKKTDLGKAVRDLLVAKME